MKENSELFKSNDSLLSEYLLKYKIVVMRKQIVHDITVYSRQQNVIPSAQVLLLLSIIHVRFVSNCPSENVFNNKCYHFSDIVLDWISAEQYCQSIGPNGHLATIDYDSVNTFLSSQFRFVIVVLILYSL